MTLRAFCVLAIGGLAALPLAADFSYQQTSQLTGGAMARMMKMMPGGGKALQPTTTSHYLKGNRMATVDEDSISVIDLDKETMTEINLKDKTYSVMTFDEFRRGLQAMQEKMAKKQTQQQAPQGEISFKIDVKDTGNTKQVSGVTTKEMLLNLEMELKDQKQQKAGTMYMENQMFMADEVPGYDEVKNFYMRMATKLNWVPGMMNQQLAAMQPSMKEATEKMMKEGAKLKGIPVMTVTKMKAANAAGEVPDMPEFEMPGFKEAMEAEMTNTAAREAGYEAARATGGRFGGLAGGAASSAMGGLMRGMRKKKQEEEKAKEPPKKAEENKGGGNLMEATSTMSNWTSASVDASKFAVPPGLKLVDHPFQKALKEK
jgi:hypothetical protein